MDKKDMRLLLETSIDVGKAGAKTAEISLIRSVVAALVEELPTTAAPTTTAPTKDSPSDAEASTDPMILASQLSGRPITPNGPVEQNSLCAEEKHQWIHLGMIWGLQDKSFQACTKCPAYKFGEEILAPVVDQTSSILARQPSSESVESSAKESAKSPSNELCSRCGKYLKFGSSDLCPECLRIDGVIP